MKKNKTPFILRIEAAVTNDGYESVKDFVRKNIRNGIAFKKIRKLIEEKYNIAVSEDTIYKELRKFAPPHYSVKLLFHFKRKRIAAKRCGTASVAYFVKGLAKVGYGPKDFARVFKTNDIKRIEEIYDVDFSGDKYLPDKVLSGIKKQGTYKKWLSISRKLGFDSVVEAMEYLLVDKNLSMRDAGWVFGVTPYRMRVRVLASDHLVRVIRQRRGLEKGGEDGTETACGTDV